MCFGCCFRTLAVSSVSDLFGLLTDRSCLGDWPPKTLCTCNINVQLIQTLSEVLQTTLLWGLRTQKLKSLKVLPLKPGLRQYIAMHATLTASDFFLANFYPSGPFTCIFSKPLRIFFPMVAVANTGSGVGPQNKKGHPAGCGFPW